jgi:sterol desaturase/sphingolipid hydroxylase (fatty acid hydroxylase superfamily)
MRRFHMEHHRSVNTTVFTSFSFHPIESFLQALIVSLILMIVPMGLVAIIVTLTLMTLSAIINHAGVEIYSTDENSNSFGRHIIGATHHDCHHRNSRKNLGLYFRFWDRLMKTEQ